MNELFFCSICKKTSDTPDPSFYLKYYIDYRVGAFEYRLYVLCLNCFWSRI